MSRTWISAAAALALVAPGGALARFRPKIAFRPKIKLPTGLRRPAPARVRAAPDRVRPDGTYSLTRGKNGLEPSQAVRQRERTEGKLERVGFFSRSGDGPQTGRLAGLRARRRASRDAEAGGDTPEGAALDAAGGAPPAGGATGLTRRQKLTRLGLAAGGGYLLGTASAGGSGPVAGPPPPPPSGGDRGFDSADGGFDQGFEPIGEGPAEAFEADGGFQPEIGEPGYGADESDGGYPPGGPGFEPAPPPPVDYGYYPQPGPGYGDDPSFWTAPPPAEFGYDPVTGAPLGPPPAEFGGGVFGLDPGGQPVPVEFAP